MVAQTKWRFEGKKFANAVKSKRTIELRITLAALAGQLQMSAATLNRTESNINNCPDLVTFATLCKWLNTPMEDFFVKRK